MDAPTRTRCPRWTRAQLDMLVAQYGARPLDEVARMLGRTPNATQTKATGIGLVKRLERAPGGKPAARLKAVDWERVVMVYQRVCAERCISPISQGKKLGIDAGQISRWRRGGRPLSADNLLLICDWMEVNPLAFLEYVADLPPTPTEA